MCLRRLVNVVTDGDHDGSYPVLRSTRATHDLSLQASWIGEEMDAIEIEKVVRVKLGSNIKNFVSFR
jgi:hypothetical protein